MNVNVQLTKEQQQYVILAVLVLGGGGYSYVKYFWAPTSAKIEKTEKEIQDVERKIAKAKGQAGRLNKIQNELKELNEKAAEAEKQLPKEQDLPGVINMVSRLSREYGLDLKSFAAGGRVNRAHFTEVTYAVSGVASYHNVGRLFAALALQERIFNVRNVIYAPAGEGKISVNFQLVSFQYKG